MIAGRLKSVVRRLDSVNYFTINACLCLRVSCPSEDIKRAIVTSARYLNVVPGMCMPNIVSNIKTAAILITDLYAGY